MSDLTNIWSKSSCLSKTQMLQYLQQKLEKEEIYVVECHLNDCPFCSDAIDGLIEADVSQTETNLLDLKHDFEQKLKNFDEEQKKIKLAEQTKKGTLSEDSNIKLLTKKRPNRQWIWAAASLFFIVGLGYSVFSFIKEYSPKNKGVAKNIGEKVSPTNPNYNLAPTDNTSEIVHLEVNPEDLPQNQPEFKSKNTNKEELTKENKVQFTPPTASKNIRMKEEELAVVNKKQEAKVTQEKAVPPDVPAYKSTAEIKADDLKEAAPGMKNFASDEKFAIAKDKSMKSEKSSIGLSKKATPTTISPATNQMEYSSSPNNDNNIEDIVATQNKAKQDLTEKNQHTEQLSIAVNNYANRNYKKAVRQLEKILPNASAAEKEEIIYYLAMSNKNLGKDKNANDYFAQLVNSKKYGKLAQSAILEYSKNVNKK